MSLKPNVWKDKEGNFYIQRCPSCLKENYAPAVATGQCAWCGFKAGEQHNYPVIKDNNDE